MGTRVRNTSIRRPIAPSYYIGSTPADAPLYILGPNHETIACPDVFRWADWFLENDRQVADTEVGNHVVSTVFLALLDEPPGAGPPVLFETMVFKLNANRVVDMRGENQGRYTTWDDAVAGHEAVVRRLQKRLGPTAPIHSPEGAEQGNDGAK